MDRKRLYMLMALLMLSCSFVVGQNAAANEQAAVPPSPTQQVSSSR